MAGIEDLVKNIRALGLSVPYTAHGLRKTAFNAVPPDSLGAHRSVDGVIYKGLTRFLPDGTTRIEMPTKNPDQDTLAHEVEHALLYEGKGESNSPRMIYKELMGDPKYDTRALTKRFVDHAPYLVKNWGLPSGSGYFHPYVYANEADFTPDLLGEQFATLSALEQKTNKNILDDPYVRKNILTTPAERESYAAMTGLRQTRLDAKDLAPYTRQPEVATQEQPIDPRKLPSFWVGMRHTLGFSSGGNVEKANAQAKNAYFI